MIKWLKQMLLLKAVLLPLLLLFCLTLAAHPDPLVAQLCFWFGPLSAGFWVLVYSQWSSHGMAAYGTVASVVQRSRRVSLHNPEGVRVAVGSFAAEVIFAFAFRLVPGGTLELWLTLFPFACYFPLFVTWGWRRRHA